MNHFKTALPFALFSLATLSTHAASTHSERILVAPTCLIQATHTTFKTLATENNFALITTNDTGIDQLIETRHAQKTLCGGFRDVTRSWTTTSDHASSFLHRQISSSAPKAKLAANAPMFTLQHAAEVNATFKQLNPQNMLDSLTTLTNFPDRYSKSDNGVRAANWIKSQLETMATTYHRNDVTIYTVATGNDYKQPSVIMKLGAADTAAIVIGAHMDTVHSVTSKRPGADDDGSGSVTVLEAARTLLASQLTFKKPIYFIWYAAEEQGCIGSDFVVTDFKNKGIPVDVVLNFDLTGYAARNESTIWLLDDYVNKDLTSFLGELVTTYVQQPVKHTECGYACSDHASWTQSGYIAAAPAESAYEDTNPNIHTAQDTMDKLSLSHMTDYLKLATAFAIETAEPVSNSN